MKPFLKWAGNKYRVLDEIRAVLPSGSRLIEPFCGSAAVSMNMDYPAYIMNDANHDLIRLYQTLCLEGQLFVDYCRTFFQPQYNQKDVYYTCRELYNRTEDPREKSALFLYLNRHAYNGLYRTNRKGMHNVPFGRYQKPYFPEREMMAFHDRFQWTTFVSIDFETVMRAAKPGDVIYADPPYLPLSKTANFTAYQAGGFSAEGQLRLVNTAREMAKQGVHVLISNHDTPLSRELYRDAEITCFSVQRNISRNGQGRVRACELLAFYPASQVDARPTSEILSGYATHS